MEIRLIPALGKGGRPEDDDPLERKELDREEPEKLDGLSEMELLPKLKEELLELGSVPLPLPVEHPVEFLFEMTSLRSFFTLR